MATSDKLIAVARAIVSEFPGGSAFVELFGDAFPSAHDRANQEASDFLRLRLNELGDRIDREYLKTDEAIDLFKSCWLIVQKTQHSEKLRGAANILANAAMEQGTEGKLTYAELDHFAACLASLSLEAIHVLREVVDPKYLNNFNPQQIAHKLGIDADLIVGLLRQLESCDFVILSFSSVRYNGQDSLVGKVRPKAKAFVEYILDAGKANQRGQ
jgi:hypothetical protein